MSAYSSQVAPLNQPQNIGTHALNLPYPEETRFVVDYRTAIIAPVAVHSPSLLVRRRKRETRRSIR